MPRPPPAAGRPARPAAGAGRPGRAGRRARRRRRGWPRRRWCARRTARRRPGSAGGRSGPCRWSGATDDTPRSSSGWCATIRSAPASSASSTVSGHAVDHAAAPGAPARRARRAPARPGPSPRPRPAGSARPARRPRRATVTSVAHGRSSLPARPAAAACRGQRVGSVGRHAGDRARRSGQPPREARRPGALARCRARAAGSTSSPKSTVTPQLAQPRDGSRRNAGCGAMAALVNGTATIGRPLPCPSTSRPRARVSAMPAAHLLIVLTVAGATIDRVGRRQHVGVAGVLVVRAHRVAGLRRRARPRRRTCARPGVVTTQTSQPSPLGQVDQARRRRGRPASRTR